MLQICSKSVPAFCLLPLVFSSATHAANQQPPVQATEDASNIVLSNGIVSIEMSKARGSLTAIHYRHDGQETDMASTMYNSASAGPTEKNPAITTPVSAKSIQHGTTHVRLTENTPDEAEIVQEGGPSETFPFHTEAHYVLRRGDSGFYVYQLYQRPTNMPGAILGEARFVIKGPTNTPLYTNHVVDDARKGPFPTSPGVRKVMDATTLLQDGSVYTKYNNTAFLANHHVHGMVGHGVGIWMVNASNEFVNGGPVKQELTVHMGDTLLNMFEGAHFGAGVQTFNHGETWNKFYGPFFVYVNHGASVDAMFDDAKTQAIAEQQKWPYQWVNDSQYPTSRGTVSGQIKLTDGESTNNAWIILAAPGGDWPMQGKGYEFWTQADKEGRFTIPKVRPGSYTLYAYGANQFEQFAKNGITVQANQTTTLGPLNWEPVKHGKTLWQIGVADRSSQEFHEGDDVRHWANYMRYPKEFPSDVTFVIGKSHEKNDWNFAQWTWYTQKPYWTIQFDVPKALTGKATLTLGFASSNPVQGKETNLQIKVNGTEVGILHQEKAGAAAYRSGGQDSLYQVQYLTFDASKFKVGTNEITLGHTEAEPFPTPDIQMHGAVGEVMYDAIRLEVSEK